MSDMYIRRGRSPSPGPFGSRWAVWVLVGLAGLFLVFRLRACSAGRRVAAPAAEEMAAVSDPAERSALRPGPAASPSSDSKSEPTVPSDPEQERASRSLLEQARAAFQDDDPGAARDLAFQALDRAQSAAGRRMAQDLLGEIHLHLAFHPYPMEEKIEYVVVRGDSLAVLARRFGTTVDLLRKGNHIQGSLIRVGNRLRILQGPFRVEISKTENELVLFLQDRFFKRYPVGTGRFDQTPTGPTRVTDRIAQPTWFKPDGRVIPYGHPENELGTHWLALDIPGYGIHGTWEPETIGQRASAGCVRLLNEDVEELFVLLPVGTDVLITE